MTALLALSGCGGVQIKNERWYGDLGPRGAVWFESLSSETGVIGKEDWDRMRAGMACTSTDTFAEIKAEIEKLCSTTACDYEKVQAALQTIQMHLDMIKAMSSDPEASK